jgi:hypothetical protein
LLFILFPVRESSKMLVVISRYGAVLDGIEQSFITRIDVSYAEHILARLYEADPLWTLVPNRA